jgi:site-specific DNA-methyltransferase (cytosine-N4-specific)
MTAATFYIGDAIHVLKTLDNDSVDLVITSPPFLALRSYLPADHPDKALEMGSEPDPGQYVDALIEVIEECRRVLAPHGSLCLELGDTYAGTALRGNGPDAMYEGRRDTADKAGYKNRAARRAGCWPMDKSLALIPETVRFALAYGRNPHTGRTTQPWRIRNVIRWVRPNPPVGALGDKFRPATSEMLVACTSGKRFFDLDAVREPHVNPRPQDTNGVKNASKEKGQGWGYTQRTVHPVGAPPLDWWNIPTHPYKGAHYATFPPELIVKPVKAMCPERVCVECGEPSRRIVRKTPEYAAFRRGNSGMTEQTDARHAYHLPDKGGLGSLNHREDSGARGQLYETTGWSDCGCTNPGGDKWRPGVVLDPFAGTGTVLQVATGHSRSAIGIDLDERNAQLALERVGPLMLNIIDTRDKEGAVGFA